MKILNNKNLTQKIIIAIVIMLSFNFVAPTYSRADVGGVLLGPVIDLIAGIGDAVMALLQYFMDGGDNIKLSSEGFLVGADEFDASKYNMQPDKDTKTATIKASKLDKGWFGWGTYGIPIIKYSPEKIFSNEIPALDANFINPKTGIDENGDRVIMDDEKWSKEQLDKSIAMQLQETISSWYNALRNFVVVVLLSILLYVGIRMMLTSISSDKAKYKQMLMDWVIALCLLFFLHYIMSFTMTFIEIIISGVSDSTTDINVVILDDELGTDVSQYLPEGKSGTGIAFKTNLTGYCRMQVQYTDLGERLVYLIFYIALVIYTFKFTWQYIKRAITMAFLTLMAPLVTLTYPIDKMGDGKAQAFNMWLKEYIFNALLQPFHLIIYSIFLGASMNIAINNPLYAILFLAFITPAENILRKFFKFDQASTAGASFAGGFGGAAAFNMVKGLINKGAKGISKTKENSGNIRQHGQLNDPNAPDGRLDPFLVGAGSEANANENSDEPEQVSENEQVRGQQQQEQERDYALEQYRNQGGRPNTQGTYFNPWTDEYDESYNPHNDPSYNQPRQTEQPVQPQPRQQTQQTQQSQQTRQPRQFQRQTGSGERSIRQMAQQNTRREIPKPIKGAVGVAKYIGKGALKVAGKGLAAGTMGVIGLGMGIAGDNLEDVFTYGMSGAALGYTTAPALANSVASRVSSVSSDIRSAYETSAYGNEEAALREQDRQFVNNQDNRDFFEEKMTEQNGEKPSRGELNKTMEVAAEYNRAGISDLKQINKTMLLEKELQQELESSTSMTEKEATKSAREQAMTIAKIANGVDAKDLRDEKKVKQLQDSFARELKSKDSSMNDQVAEAQASRIIAMVKKQKKIY